MKKKSYELIKNGFIAGILSGTISALLNYFVLPFPVSVLRNAMSHGIGGFFSGFISAVVGIVVYLKQNNQTSL